MKKFALHLLAMHLLLGSANARQDVATPGIPPLKKAVLNHRDSQPIETSIFEPRR